jgi:hypothetical protein
MLTAVIAAVSGNCPPTETGCPGFSYPPPILTWIVFVVSLLILTAVLFGWRRE